MTTGGVSADALAAWRSGDTERFATLLAGLVQRSGEELTYVHVLFRLALSGTRLFDDESVLAFLSTAKEQLPEAVDFPLKAGEMVFQAALRDPTAVRGVPENVLAGLELAFVVIALQHTHAQRLEELLAEAQSIVEEMRSGMAPEFT